MESCSRREKNCEKSAEFFCVVAEHKGLQHFER